MTYTDADSRGEWPREITFEEIQVGDTIESRIEYSDHTSSISGIIEAIQHDKYFSAVTEFGTKIATSLKLDGRKIMLLARPKPNPFTVVGVGSLAVSASVHCRIPYLKVRENMWKPIDESGYLVDTVITDMKMFVSAAVITYNQTNSSL